MRKILSIMGLGVATALTLAACTGQSGSGGSDGTPEISGESWSIPALYTDCDATDVDPAGCVGEVTEVEYKSLSRDEVTKDWTLCAALPHLKDSIWISSAYGLTHQAQQLDVNLSVVEAGGYENLAEQVSQIEDCISAGADAVLVAAVSFDSLNPVLEQARAQGVVVVDYGNGVSAEAIDGRVVTDYRDMGFMLGQHMAGLGEQMNVAVFPGPAGVGWSERSLSGFESAIAGSSINIIDVKYGDTGREIQLKLVEDVLASNPEIDALVGNAPMLEAASSVLAEQGKEDQIKLYSTYNTPEIMALLESSRASCSSVEQVVRSGETGVDLAVRILEGKFFEKPNSRVSPEPLVICGPAEGDANNLDGFDQQTTFAPKGWQPTTFVESSRG